VTLSVLVWCVVFLGPPGAFLWLAEYPNRRREVARAAASMRGALIIAAGFFLAYIAIDLLAFHSWTSAIGHAHGLGVVAWFNYRRATEWAPPRADRRTRDNHERLP